MSPSRVKTRPLEFCPNCASYLTISPRLADSAPGFQNYFTCRACPYIFPVSESESSGDKFSGDNETTDNEAVGNKAVANDPVAKATNEPAK
ncbi:hypothetical protein N7447_007173 [Penicillium robsamsonii]|uniref:uncharacterized protein n=1 Tax=Penicillium robsamsonii TaxID=1792511 RepID=UPI002549A0BE|nr:uncharacterized protein N7447_007173 [Penicillium robsamsonii]KAJ5824833.1 hypothetical protein N7447_007173 [Penicillium robsamsonii]